MEGIKPLTMLVLLSRFTNWATEEAFYWHGIIQKYSAAQGSALKGIPRPPYQFMKSRALWGAGAQSQGSQRRPWLVRSAVSSAGRVSPHKVCGLQQFQHVIQNVRVWKKLSSKPDFETFKPLWWQVWWSLLQGTPVWVGADVVVTYN